MESGIRGVEANFTWLNGGTGDILNGMGQEENIFVVNDTMYFAPFCLTG